MAVQLRQERLVGLVDAAARHDHRAVRELVETCGADIARYCRRRGSADSEALANLVFAEFFAALPRLNFDADQQVWALLYRIARNRLVDEFRRQTLDPNTETLVEVQQFAQPDPAESVVDRDWLRGLLCNLSEDQQRIIELRFGEDLSLAETAKRTGKSVGAVKALQHRAVAALATLVTLAGLLLALGLSQPSSDERIISVPADGGTGSSGYGGEGRNSGAGRQTLETPPAIGGGRERLPSAVAPETQGAGEGLDLGAPLGASEPRPADESGTETGLLEQSPAAPTTTAAGPPTAAGDPSTAVTADSDADVPATTTVEAGTSTSTGDDVPVTTAPVQAPVPKETTTVTGELPEGGEDGQSGERGEDGAESVAPATTTTEAATGRPASELTVTDDIVVHSRSGSGALVQLDLLANDLGVDINNVSLVSLPHSGSAFLVPVGVLGNTEPLFRYMPDSDPETTTFVYQACDTAGTCQTATVTIVYMPAG